MAADTKTLFKLMVLYMLKRVSFPISNAQMSAFFLDAYYTDYFTFQNVISELLESSLIQRESTHNATMYRISQEGEEVLFYFEDRLDADVRADIDKYLEKNSYELRSENSIVADYVRHSASEYEVRMEVKEGAKDLIDLRLSVPNEEQAIQMCDQWKSHAEEVYNFLIRELMQ